MPQPQDQPATHLTITRAAKRSSVSARAVRRWIDNHGLPSVQIQPRGRVLIAVSDLEHFLASHRRTGNTLHELVEQTWTELQPSTRKTGGRAMASARDEKEASTHRDDDGMRGKKKRSAMRTKATRT